MVRPCRIYGDLSHWSKACPQHGMMVGYVQLGQSRGRMSYAVKGGDHYVDGGVAGIRVEVGHNPFNAFTGRPDAEAIGIDCICMICLFCPSSLILCLFKVFIPYMSI